MERNHIKGFELEFLGRGALHAIVETLRVIAVLIAYAICANTD